MNRMGTLEESGENVTATNTDSWSSKSLRAALVVVSGHNVGVTEFFSGVHSFNDSILSVHAAPQASRRGSSSL